MTDFRTKNVLIVGFGNMGCRHAQSLVNSEKKHNIFVFEKYDEKYNEGLKKIGISENRFIRIKNLDKIDYSFDIAIIATSSGPRYEILKKLLPLGISNYLLEKIVFQSQEQFEEIIELAHAYQSKLYCNFINRYFSNYILLKQDFKNIEENIKMNIYAGNLGLGCNAIHYLDLFEYTTESKIVTMNSNLETWDEKNKRGSQYKEFSGVVSAQNKKGDYLTLYFDPSHIGGAEISFYLKHKTFLLSENNRKEYMLNDDVIEERVFNLLPTSQLTSKIVDDIYEQKCLLTEVEETYSTHNLLFLQIFNHLGIKNKAELCPIT